MFASREFSSPALGDTILVISDADDTASTLSKKEVKEAVARSGIRLFFFLLSASGSGHRLRHRLLRRELAEASGGLWQDWHVESEQTNKALQRVQPLYKAINLVYRLEIKFPTEID
jgi:hypothetical protein